MTAAKCVHCRPIFQGSVGNVVSVQFIAVVVSCFFCRLLSLFYDYVFYVRIVLSYRLCSAIGAFKVYSFSCLFVIVACLYYLIRIL